MHRFNNTFPTPYPELNLVLSDLTHSVAGILGDNFCAACLQGSFAIGDFDGDSDVDFLIVTHDEIAGVHLPALQATHARIFSSLCPWAQHLEGSYFPKSILRNPTDLERELWYLDNGSQSLLRSTHCNTVAVRWTVREHGIALAGPDARSLVEPVSSELLRSAVFKTMCQWGGTSLPDDPSQINSFWYQTFVVVLYCRMLYTLHCGRIVSKLASVTWALENLHSRWNGLIQRAWDQRANTAAIIHQPPDPSERGRTIEFVRWVIRQRSGMKNSESKE